MRFLLAIAVVVGLAAPVYAQATTEQPRTLDSLTQKDIEREQQQQQWTGPSGFWTSPHKSEHGAYRYRMLGIGLALMAITGFFTWRLIKRAR